MINPKDSITATIEGNVIDITYVSELEIDTVLTYHYVTYSVWPGPLFIVLYSVLAAKLWTPLLTANKLQSRVGVRNVSKLTRS